MQNVRASENDNGAITVGMAITGIHSMRSAKTDASAMFSPPRQTVAPMLDSYELLKPEKLLVNFHLLCNTQLRSSDQDSNDISGQDCSLDSDQIWR